MQTTQKIRSAMHAHRAPVLDANACTDVAIKAQMRVGHTYWNLPR